MQDFGHGLDSILTDSSNIPELDGSLYEADAMPSSVYSGFLHSVLFFDISGLLVNYGARPELRFCLSCKQVKYQLLS